METTALRKRINEVIKPVQIVEETMPDVVDYLVSLEELKERIQEEVAESKKELLDKLKKIESKEKELTKIVDDEIGKVRGMVNNYFTNKVQKGEIVDKTFVGGKGKMTLIADVTIEVTDQRAILKGVYEGAYGPDGDNFVKINESAIKKFVKATKMVIDGVKINNSVYIRITKTE